ncbi:MAG: hypothetical protein A2X63_08385 [Ignavibacteria bacterium GWA2_35_8]|nr:MAG: hypothetical protein A2X63_08385 [Ignavibacteria bacterium GWA2_35_8]
MLVKLLFIFIFIIQVNLLLGQIEGKHKYPRIQSDCIKLLVIEDSTKGKFNPDSVLVDSCQDPPIIYVYRWFNVVFKNYVINLPAAPEDTTLDVTWEAISSSYTQLRSDFQELENKFGSYYFRKISPEITDSNHIGSRVFFIGFNEYVNRDSIVEYLSKIEGLNDFYYLDRVAVYLEIPKEPGVSQYSAKVVSYSVQRIINLNKNQFMKSRFPPIPPPTKSQSNILLN